MTSLDTTVRRATEADREAVLRLLPRLLEFGPPSWRSRDEMAAADRDVISAALRSNSEDPIVLVADIGDNLAGFIHLHSAVDYYRRRAHGHVADLVVAPEFEGRGIASTLLSAGDTWGQQRGYDWLTISVFPENHRALHLYEHVGFQRDTLRLLKVLDPMEG